MRERPCPLRADKCAARLACAAPTGRRARGARILTAFLCFCAVAGKPAASSARRHRVPALRWQAHLEMEQAYTDNLQAQPGTLRQGEWLTTLEGYFALDHGGRQPWLPDRSALTVRSRLFRRFSGFDYAELQPGVSYDLGKRTELSVVYGFTPKRLLFGENDGGPGVFYREHLVWFIVRHKFGLHKRLRVRAISETRWRDFRPPATGRSGSILGGSLDLRYLVSPLFTPQVGARLTRRDTRRGNYDRDRVGFWSGFSTQMACGVRARFRYKRSWRNYTVGSNREASGRRNSDFRRDDDIQTYETLIAFPVPGVAGLSMRARYQFRSGDSSRADRIFDIHEYGLEIFYRFQGLVGN